MENAQVGLFATAGPIQSGIFLENNVVLHNMEVAVCVLCQMASVVRGLFGSEHSLLVCASVGAVVYVVCGDAWPILLSPCNTAWSNAPRKVCNTTWAYTA